MQLVNINPETVAQDDFEETGLAGVFINETDRSIIVFEGGEALQITLPADE